VFVESASVSRSRRTRGKRVGERDHRQSNARSFLQDALIFLHVSKDTSHFSVGGRLVLLRAANDSTRRPNWTTASMKVRKKPSSLRVGIVNCRSPPQCPGHRGREARHGSALITLLEPVVLGHHIEAGEHERGALVSEFLVGPLQDQGAMLDRAYSRRRLTLGSPPPRYRYSIWTTSLTESEAREGELQDAREQGSWERWQRRRHGASLADLGIVYTTQKIPKAGT